MKMKIKDIHYNVEELSASAKMTRFLIKINILPLYGSSNFEKIRFSWFSLRTLIYLLLAYLPVPLLVVLVSSQPEFYAKYAEAVGNSYNKIDIMVMVTFFCIPVVTGPIFVLTICEAFCQLKVVTLKSSLKFMEWSDFATFCAGYILC